MNKFSKKIVTVLAGLAILSTAGFAASTSSDSSAAAYTSTDNVKKAQIAMASNEYIVTAGDIYTLAFSSGSYSISVDSTYKVRIANLGIINAQGLTIQEFKNKVESLIVNNYPSGGVQFFLANPAQFHVYVKGEVETASTVETWALVHASDLLSSFYTDYSSKRFFTVISADGTKKEYDLYQAERYGDFSQDPYLRPGDTIVVQRLSRLVTLEGAVYREGEYELKAGEELQSLIFDYGDGFNPYADRDHIELQRFVGKSDMYEAVYMKESDLHADTPLACYDKVYVGSYEDKRGVFYVEGAVFNNYDIETRQLIIDNSDDDDAEDYSSTTKIVLNPGEVVTEPSTIARVRFPYSVGKSAIQVAKENKLMFTNSADLKNAYVWRKNKDTNEDEKIYIDLNAVLYPSQNSTMPEDVLLQADDIIVIPYTQYYVSVTGYVGSTGLYSYQPNRDWKYYANLAGGINKTANPFSIVKITDKDGKKISKKAPIPPEANIYSVGYTPSGSWVLSLLTATMSFITTCFTFYFAVKSYQLF